MESPSTSHWLFSIVYISTSMLSHYSLWNIYAGLETGSLPWILYSDFNTILSTDDKLGGRPFQLSNFVLDFQNFIFRTGLYFDFHEQHFTWCNNRYGSYRISARLDRVLRNQSWFNLFINYSPTPC